jgi:beta-glucosidase
VDPALLHRVSSVIADEARAKNVEALKHNNHWIFFDLTIWSPNINIFRDPRWGRGQETYGEDPYLTSRLGVAFVEGLQGDDPKYYEAIATPKHYAVHSGPESERHRFNATPSAFDLEETYLPAFRATITEAKADSIMCAYNAIYGFPACASPLLLKQKLRGAWKFEGFVTSDCGAIGDFYSTEKQGFSGTRVTTLAPMRRTPARLLYWLARIQVAATSTTRCRVFFADAAGFERGRRTGQPGRSTGRVFGDDQRRAAFGRGA